MSDDRKDSPSQKPPASVRPSLREIAQRASQLPPRASIPPSEGSDPTARGHFPSVQPTATEDEEDSGIVDLNAIRASVVPESPPSSMTSPKASMPAGAGQAPLSNGSLPSDSVVAPSRHPSAAASLTTASATPIAAAKAEISEAKGKSSGLTIALLCGGLLVLGGIGLALTSKSDPLPTEAQKGPGAASDTKLAAPTTHAGREEQPTKDTPPDAKEPLEAAAPGAVAPSAKDTSTRSAAPSSAAANAAATAKAQAEPAPPGDPGDLNSAMKKAVGPTKDDAGEAIEASSGPKSNNQTIPEQPSQGSVQAAVGAVMPSAKACVAGATDVTRAQITFGSSGKATSVVVTGWAQANGGAGCVKSALSGANVGAFSKPSYSFSVTIRP